MEHERNPPPTFADACEAVLANPDGDHSLYTTLAPLYDRMMASADARSDAQFALVDDRVPAEAQSVLAVGCGTGRLLSRLDRRFATVVGLDDRPELLAFARRIAPDAELVAADATDPSLDLGRSFDAAVALEDVLAHTVTDEEVRGLFDAVRRHLRPGGAFVCDAVADPAAVREEAVSVYSQEPYRLERAVDVVPAAGLPGVELVVDYRVTDVTAGRSATATERLTVRTFTPDGLREALDAAGFVEVAVESGDGSNTAGERGSLVAMARAPDG